MLLLDQIILYVPERIFQKKKIDDKFKEKKVQYNINREAAKISALSSHKIGKYEYLIGGEILPSNRIQTAKQSRFIYSLL